MDKPGAENAPCMVDIMWTSCSRLVLMPSGEGEMSITEIESQPKQVQRPDVARYDALPDAVVNTLASQSSGTALRAIAFPTASSSPDMTTKPFKAFCNSGKDRSMTSMSLLYRMHSCTKTYDESSADVKGLDVDF